MPTFTTIALDRLLEPGTSKSVDKSLPKPKPALTLNRAPSTKLERRNSASVADRKVQRPQIKPALYTTPEATPLPDSPSSFPPSPYIVNHKRRGPRLLKSFSEDDVSRKKMNDNDVGNGSVKGSDSNDVKSTEGSSVTVDMPIPEKDGDRNGPDCASSSNVRQNGSVDGDHGATAVQLVNNHSNHESRIVVSNGVAREKNSLKVVVSNSESIGDTEDFFDPHDSLSVTSNTDGEDNGFERSAKFGTPMGEFYDAWEELSSEGLPQPSISDIEAELREMKLTLLMELEKRKQAEEALNKLQGQWWRLREQLLLVGLTLPSDPPVATEGNQLDSDPAEELCQQVYLARFVSDSIGRGIARAEVETEMEAQLEVKNFEIARLLDRLHYYEAVNHEMSQRNQEAVDLARRERLRRKRRQRWIWGSVATAITLGTAVLAWSYLPSGKDLPSSNNTKAEHDDVTD
ncbi:uncharacterized protein LOC120073808 [Benincasa hispida]|uniref:uncharacterized protein LOC120073808 n=1 Tax=Benincasa hispida TaxID=102211 RepID=UPI00190031A1|nr:uncharacterized protein LOC120073808 [Benincasa hispida]